MSEAEVRFDTVPMFPVIYIMISGAGVVIEGRYVSSTDSETALLISVPEHSYRKDIDGNELAGKRLVSNVSYVMKTILGTSGSIKCRVRKGETWTRTDSKHWSRVACDVLREGNMGKNIFG